MPEENVCPNCGAPQSPRRVAGPSEGKPRSDSPIENEDRPAPVELLASGSNDETFLANPHGPMLISAEPDPILGAFSTPSSREFPESSAAAGRSHRPHSPRRDGPEPAFPSLNFDGASKPAKRGDSKDEYEEDEPPDRRNSWVSILLLSYASAITLALVWTLWRAPRGREALPEATPASVAEDLPTVGRQAGLSRKVGLPEPILSRNILALKQPLQLGSLEVTPLEVRREKIGLQRTSFSGKVDRKEGGKNSLALRLRLRNTSKDEVFAPLDQAFLREQQQEKNLVDSFVETDAGERIYPFPLAVESEWAIIGQEFGELRPGETRLVTVVSAPDAPGDEAGPFTWRVRLRTGIDRTDIIGVRWPDPASRPK